MKTEPLLSSTFQPMMVISHIWRAQSKLFKMPASGPPLGAPASDAALTWQLRELRVRGPIPFAGLLQARLWAETSRVGLKFSVPQKWFLLLPRRDHRLKNLSCHCPNWRADPWLPAQQGPSVPRPPRVRFLGLITDSPWEKGAKTEGVGCRYCPRKIRWEARSGRRRFGVGDWTRG